MSKQRFSIWLNRVVFVKIHRIKKKYPNVDRQSPDLEAAQALKHVIDHVRDRRGQPLINIQINAFQVRAKTSFVLTFKSLAMHSPV